MNIEHIDWLEPYDFMCELIKYKEDIQLKLTLHIHLVMCRCFINC